MFGDRFEEGGHYRYCKGARCSVLSPGEPSTEHRALSGTLRSVQATPLYGRAIAAVSDLLTALRIDHLYLGGVARAAWLGGDVDAGSIDVLALMGPQQKSQVAMMARNRGFRVYEEEIDAAEELDLVPITFADAEGDVRVHVLVATNALYGSMFRNAFTEPLGDRNVSVPSAEDFALILALSGDDAAVWQLVASPSFDRSAYNEKVTAIGLASHTI